MLAQNYFEEEEEESRILGVRIYIFDCFSALSGDEVFKEVDLEDDGLVHLSEFVVTLCA